jgi:hypothetical protein
VILRFWIRPDVSVTRKPFHTRGLPCQKELAIHRGLVHVVPGHGAHLLDDPGRIEERLQSLLWRERDLMREAEGGDEVKVGDLDKVDRFSYGLGKV